MEDKELYFEEAYFCTCSVIKENEMSFKRNWVPLNKHEAVTTDAKQNLLYYAADFICKMLKFYMLGD